MPGRHVEHKSDVLALYPEDNRQGKTKGRRIEQTHAKYRRPKSRLFMATTNSVLLYGSEHQYLTNRDVAAKILQKERVQKLKWAIALNVSKFRRRMASAQQTEPMRIASSYRTVSSAAVRVIARVIPIDLLAQKHKRIYERSAEVGRAEAASEERRRTLEDWQRRWNNDTSGR